VTYRRRHASFTLPLVVALIAVAVAVFAYVYLMLQAPSGPGGESGAPAVAEIGGPFALTDQTGTPRTDADFRGRLMLVYFGYSFCPDVCSLALSTMGTAIDDLGDKGRDVVPIFVTVDPDRDTVARLADYSKNFHPRLVALTGSKGAITAAAKAYHVYFARSGQESGADYLMDHTSIIYLMGRDGRYLAHFGPTATPGQMAAEIAKHL
jgi:protein SCO1/2